MKRDEESYKGVYKGVCFGRKWKHATHCNAITSAILCSSHAQILIVRFPWNCYSMLQLLNWLPNVAKLGHVGKC